MGNKLKKYAIATALIILVLFVIRKIKTSMFKEMDTKMKAIGLPVVAYVVGTYVIKKEEYSMPITIGALITFLVGVLEVTGSDKFKVEDLGLAGDMMTTEFGSMEEMNNYIQANLPMTTQGDSDDEVNGDEVEIYRIPQTTQGELKLDDLFGELAGNNVLVVE